MLEPVSGERMNNNYLIREITFPDGKNFRPPKLTILVGPNNAGKSRFLRNLRNKTLGYQNTPEDELARIVYSFPVTAEKFISQYDIHNHIKLNEQGFYSLIDYCPLGMSATHNGYERIRPSTYNLGLQWEDEIKNMYSLTDDSVIYNNIHSYFGALFINYCSTEDRLLLASGEKYFGTNDSDTNMLSWAFQNPEIMAKIGREAKRLFNKDIELDISSRSGYVIPKVANDFERYRCTTRSDFSKINVLAKAQQLANEGDGLKSFFAVAMSIISNKKPIIVIDEPEAFLHPPQAFELGRLIANEINIAKTTQAFIATHSSRLLQGILSSSLPLTDIAIIRLDRRDHNSAYTIVDSKSFNEVMQRPTLKSGKFFDGIFAEKLILVESESDELIYSALISKLQLNDDILLMNVHGKMEFHVAVDFFKQVGVRCNIIADFDLLNNKDTLKVLANSLTFSDSDQKLIHDAAVEIHDSIISEFNLHTDEKSYKAKFKQFDDSTFSSLSTEIKTIRELFLQHGCLILATGELETVLEDLLPYSKTKDNWLNNALSKIDHTSIEEISRLQISNDLRELLTRDIK